MKRARATRDALIGDGALLGFMALILIFTVHRLRHRLRDRQRQRQTDRDTEREREREGEGKGERQKHRQTDKYRNTDRDRESTCIAPHCTAPEVTTQRNET